MRLVLLACLLTWAGCEKKSAAPGTPGTSDQRTSLVLNWVPEPEFGGWYQARESGAFKKRGLVVEIKGGGAGVPVLQMVASGQSDFGITGADELLTARARGVDLVALYASFQTSPMAIMTHAARGAKSLADVFSSQGGTLAMEPGHPYALFLKKKFGFAKLQVVPYDGGVARFVKDPQFSQQCFITSEPIAAKRAGSDPKTFLIADEGFNPYVGLLVARRALVREQPALVRAFVDATREGWRAYLDDPAPANAVMAKLNQAMDPATFAAAAEAQKPLCETAETKIKGLGTIDRGRFETLGKQLVELGVIERAPAPDDYL